MDQKISILEKLKEYGKSDYYPFHMPGHKRNFSFPNPFSIDITEIHGFDNLHHPEGILKESMDWASSLYGADRTYYLINGSSAGILSAICGVTNNSDTILFGRNSHKSAYHGVFLNHLWPEYTYPQMIEDFGVQGGLLSDDIEKMLKTRNDIKAVFIVSPTYEGIVSDIKTIATITHKYKIPLIVDEAHGAHFRYGEDFPQSALELGADIVIQSLHKTLPAFTQTALLHVKQGYVDIDKIEQYLQIYQSSSPSYVFLAGIENCIQWMEDNSKESINEFFIYLHNLRERLGNMKCLKLLGNDIVGKHGVYDLDESKIIISTRGVYTDSGQLSGTQLAAILREKYHIEMEMCGLDYVTAITTVADTEEGLKRLEYAFIEIDKDISEQVTKIDSHQPGYFVKPSIAMNIYDAMNEDKKTMELKESAGYVCGEYVYVYPPGIPIIVPGEILQDEIIQVIVESHERGLSVQGIKDETLGTIQVLNLKEK